MADRFPALVDQLLSTLATRAGALGAEVRNAALKHAAALGGAVREGGALPAELAGFVEKVAKHAYRTTDEDFAALAKAGYSEDQLFELTLAAAAGAAWARLDRGLAALRGQS